MSRKPIPEESRVFLRRLGVAISEERRAQRLKQEELGARAGVSGSRIGEIERGLVNTSMSRLLLIAGALGVPASELLRRVERVAGGGPATELQRSRIIAALRGADPRVLDVVALFVRLMLAGRGGR